MSLRRWKQKFAGAKDAVAGAVSGAVDVMSEKASNIMNTNLTLETAQNELANDIEKGVRIFDEIGLPQEVGDNFQEEIAEFAVIKLKEAWEHPQREKEN